MLVWCLRNPGKERRGRKGISAAKPLGRGVEETSSLGENAAKPTRKRTLHYKLKRGRSKTDSGAAALGRICPQTR